MTEVWSLSPMHHRLEHERLTYRDAVEILDGILKQRKYLSFDDFFYTTLKEHSLCLRSIRCYHTKNPRLKIGFIREKIPPYCIIMYIRAPSDPDSRNILKLHLLLYEVIPEDSQTNTEQSLLYNFTSDGTIVDMSHTDSSYSDANETISELLYNNLKLLYTCLCDNWFIH